MKLEAWLVTYEMLSDAGWEPCMMTFTNKRGAETWRQAFSHNVSRNFSDPIRLVPESEVIEQADEVRRLLNIIEGLRGEVEGAKLEKLSKLDKQLGVRLTYAGPGSPLPFSED